MFQDEEAEYKLLIALLSDQIKVLRVSDSLFTGERRAIFLAFKQAFLEDKGIITREGVRRFYPKPLPQAMEAVDRKHANESHIEPLTKYLKDLAMKRHIEDVISKLQVVKTNSTIERGDLIKILEVPSFNDTEDSNVQEGVSSFVSRLVQKRDKNYRFIDTGLPFLNNALGGEYPREGLTLIMGTSGGGKTALCLQSAFEMAKKGIPTLFFSLEMPKEQLVARCVASLCDIDGILLMHGAVRDEDMPKINEALELLQSLPLYIIDTPAMSVYDIVYQCLLHKKKYGIEAFFIDYLQYIDRPDSNVHEELGNITKVLRNCARELKIAGVVISQRNRSQQGLSSIQGSSIIENVIDVAMTVTMEPPTAGSTFRLCAIEFHKNRNGPLDTVPCIFIPKFLKYISPQ